MLLSIIYEVVRRLLDALTVVIRREITKDVELLVLRHENAVPRRQVASIRRTPVDRLRLAAPSRLPPASAGPRFLQSGRRRCWPGIATSWRATGTTARGAGRDAHQPRRRSGSWSCGWPKKTRARAIGESRARWYDSDTASPPRPSGTFCTPPVSIRHTPAIGPDLATIPDQPGPGHVAVDFLHVEAITLRRLYAVIVVKQRLPPRPPRRGQRAPDWRLERQAARNLIIDLADRIGTVTLLLRDRDSRFTVAFDAVFIAEGIRIVRTPHTRQGRTRSANAWWARCAGNCSTEF
jgi:hypothetical protein